MEQLLLDVQTWARQALTSEVFPRGDYHDLHLVIVKFLGADPPGFRFKIPKPKTVSNARFMQIAEYYIVMELLSFQLNFLTNEQQKEVSDMAFICALFYSLDF